MNQNKLAIIAIGLWVVTLAVFALLMIQGQTRPGKDQRTEVLVAEADKVIIMKEMRNFLANLHQVIAAATENRLAEVPEWAAKSGQAQVEMVPPGLMMKLPLEFKKMGRGVHQAFDDLARVAKAQPDRDQILAAAGEIMSRCVACHSAYQIVIAPE